MDLHKENTRKLRQTVALIEARYGFQTVALIEARYGFEVFNIDGL